MHAVVHVAWQELTVVMINNYNTGIRSGGLVDLSHNRCASEIRITELSTITIHYYIIFWPAAFIVIQMNSSGMLL